MVVVHGDDFHNVGAEGDLGWLLGKLRQAYQLKRRGRIGGGPKDTISDRVLSRIVGWRADGGTGEVAIRIQGRAGAVRTGFLWVPRGDAGH